MKISEFGQAWCQKVVDWLVAHGCSHFFIAPGSRSSPLIAAVINNPAARIFSGIDERSLGYMALGFSKASNQTGVVVVTSGTALSNLSPAVCEAFSSEVPLLILSADRPFELHDCGANQTMKQSNFFFNQVNKSFDLSPPDASVPMAKILGIFSHAIKQTKAPTRGPVHVNIQLRDGEQNAGEAAVPNFLPPMSDGDRAHRLVQEISAKRGLIAVGELLPSGLQAEILKLSEALGWPIYADIASNLRLKGHPNILHHFEPALGNPSFVEALDVDVVLSLGGRFVSKRFWNALLKLKATRFFRLSESTKRLDQSGLFDEIAVSDLPVLLQKVYRDPKLRPCQNGFSALRKIHDGIKAEIAEFLEIPNSEAKFATRLIARIPTSANLFVSSSMPIRYLDIFAQARAIDIDIFVNRGLSGIDGVLSSAVGMACTSPRFSLLLIGDVAFLHDTNGLMLLASSPNPLLVVVINNQGGVIFHLLPAASNKDLLTPYLDTPHRTNFSFLCKAHSIPHVEIAGIEQFDLALKNFFSAPRSMVIEVITDKEQNASWHKEIMNKISTLRGHDGHQMGQ